MPYCVYLLRCADGTYYTGICTDLARRLAEHNGERPGGAKYTASRRPVLLAYAEPAANRSEASKREYALKRLSRTEKKTLTSAYAPQ